MTPTKGRTVSGVELAACPFCGGEASDAGHTKYTRPLDDATWLDGSPIREAFFVNCIPCGASSRNSLFGGYQTKAEAIAAWNRRAVPMEAVAWRDELRSIIFSATHAVLPLADDVTGIGIRERAAMQVEIADRILQALALIPQAEET